MSSNQRSLLEHRRGGVDRSPQRCPAKRALAQDLVGDWKTHGLVRTGEHAGAYHQERETNESRGRQFHLQVQRRLPLKPLIRPFREDERGAILAIINAAAEAYRDVIPADRWHEPYMPAAELDHEIAAGVEFCVYEADGALVGAMGVQPVRDVDLIRHAYVLPGNQRLGIGGALLGHLRASSARRMLVGTWAAAEWAIRFYQRHGFQLVSPETKTELLKTY